MNAIAEILAGLIRPPSHRDTDEHLAVLEEVVRKAEKKQDQKEERKVKRKDRRK